MSGLHFKDQAAFEHWLAETTMQRNGQTLSPSHTPPHPKDQGTVQHGTQAGVEDDASPETRLHRHGHADLPIEHLVLTAVVLSLLCWLLSCLW